MTLKRARTTTLLALLFAAPALIASAGEPSSQAASQPAAKAASQPAAKPANTAKVAGTAGRVEIRVSGIRNDKGIVNAGLYTSDDGWPKDRSKAFKVVRGRIKNGRAFVAFSDVPFGTYSFAIFHDENNDGELETNFFGKPQEGVCTANNAEKKNLPPKWKNALFKLDAPSTKLKVKMTYLD